MPSSSLCGSAPASNARPTCLHPAHLACSSSPVNNLKHPQIKLCFELHDT